MADTFKDGDQVIYTSQSGAREYYATVIGPPIFVGKNRKVTPGVRAAITPGHRIQIHDFTEAHRDHMRANYPGWTSEDPKARYRFRTVADASLRHQSKVSPA